MVATKKDFLENLYAEILETWRRERWRQYGLGLQRYQRERLIAEFNWHVQQIARPKVTPWNYW